MRLLLERLDAELLALQAVLHAMEDECTALERRDADALLRVSERKSAAVAEAASLKVAREDDPDYRQCMQAPEEAPAAFRHRLQALRSLAERCQQLNESNGRLIHGQRRRVEGTLNLLRGGSAAPDAYDRSGAASYAPRKALRNAC